ncbi:MAG: MFS transporter [Bacillota bacterium]|nr:MFS transporter [Bacillota bacterium]
MKNKSLKHWLIVLCCCGISASSIGTVVNTAGVFYEPICQDLGVLRGSVAMHTTLACLATAIVCLFAPSLLKRYNFKMLIFVGALLTAGSTILMAFSRSILVFNILGTIKGIGAGMYHMLLMSKILNNWFSKSRGLATSIAFSFSGVAGAILSPILNTIIQHAGWEQAYIVLGILSFLFVLPALLIPFSLDPRKDGYLPYGYEQEEQNMTKEEVSFNPWSKAFILFILIGTLTTFVSGFTSHLPGYASSLGISATIGALLISGGMIGNIGSKILLGILSDLFGVFKSIYLMIGINILSLVLLLFIPVDFVMICTSVLFGSIYGISAVGLPLLTKEFFGEQAYVKAFSYVSFAMNVGGAVALSIIGYVFDWLQSYPIIIVLLIVVQIFNSIGIYLLKK